MTKTQKIKRKAVGRILWHSVGILESTMYHLGEQLHVDAGVPIHRKSPLRGTLSESEFQALGKCITKMRVQIENFRKIAKHLERGTDASK